MDHHCDLILLNQLTKPPVLIVTAVACTPLLIGNIWVTTRNKKTPLAKLLTRGVEYVCNKFGSHKKIQEQLQDTLSKQNEQLRKLEETRRNQQLMLEDYSERLSAEMGKKISANESSVENVGIRNRPMNIADEFDQLCSNEWFSAKEVCDEKCEDAAESEKIKILYNIMMLAEHQTNSIFEELYKKTNVMLTNPFGGFEPGNSIKTIGNNYSKYAQQTGEGTDIAIEIEQDPGKVNGCTEESPKLPLELTNSMGDYLRKQADVVDLTCVEKAFSARLEFLSNKINPDIWECVKDDTAIRTYILSTLRLAWKMAIQRPKMEFKGSDQWLGDRFQDLYWSSVNPEEMKMPSFTVNPVYPMLYHGKQFMKKGKVLILKT